jgi:hypothetical protein
MAAWLAVLALYALTGSVAPAYAKLPTVTSVTPSSGPATGGTAVTVVGTKFTTAKAVKFGSTNATSFTVNSGTSLTATSPAAPAGKVDVTVTTQQGTSPISSNDTFELTPTITGISPNTGPPAGGTNVTITGSGFAVGKAATGITFGAIEAELASEAVGVNCTTTTECTATTPELSDEQARELGPTVDVTATVNNVRSPQTAAGQFHYHGLLLMGERGRLPVGTVVNLRGVAASPETSACFTFLGGSIGSNGETTDEIDTGVEGFASCLPEEWFGGLPGSFALRLSEDGSATIEGPMGVRTNKGCVYEGNRLDGSFELNAPLKASLGGTLTLVAEEEPGAECAATEHVEASVLTDRFTPYAELFG